MTILDAFCLLVVFPEIRKNNGNIFSDVESTPSQRPEIKNHEI